MRFRPEVLLLTLAVAGAQSPLNRMQSPESGSARGGSSGSYQQMPGVQTGFNGSIPTGDLAANLDLSLRDALSRALKYNLALVDGNENTAIARAQRLRALSLLLPTLNIRPSITEQQVNLAAFGLTLPGIPTVVGPFHIYDARVYGAEQVSFESLRSFQASRSQIRASELTLRDARDQVIAIVVQLYLQAIAGSARIDAGRAQVATADSLYKRAADRKSAGTVPAIDVLRAQVELQTQQQRLIVAEGEFEKQKLAIARAIGLPLGQRFRLADTIPYLALPSTVDLDSSLEQAYKTRSDFQAADAQVKSAELTLSSARAGWYPTAGVNADYGANGLAVDRLHGSFTVAGFVNVPVFQGGRVKANVEEARARLSQIKAQRDDLRGRIDADVRTAFIDLRSSARQVDVAGSNLELAQQQVTQAQDRFGAGVANNLEVVQAQDALAAANENYINALYAYNAGKAALARARGDSEESVLQYLNIK